MVIPLQNTMWNMKHEHDKKEGTMTQYECQRVMNDEVFLHDLSVLMQSQVLRFKQFFALKIFG